PAPATTKAVAVETLKVPAASPPVPQVSISISRSVPDRAATSSPRVRTLTAFCRITWAKPISSSTVSPFMRSPVRNAAIWASVAAPAMIASIAAAASMRVRAGRAAQPRTASVMGHDHLVPGVGEDVADHVAHLGVVVDDQAARGAAGGADAHARRGHWLGARPGQALRGERHPHGRATAQAGIDLDLTAVTGHDAVGQAHAEAGGARFRREERFEYPDLGGRRHARAGVGDGDHRLAVFDPARH